MLSVKFIRKNCFELAKIAIKHRLYVRGLVLEGILKDMLDLKDSKLCDNKVEIATIEDYPVGCATLTAFGHIHCFVRRAFRKFGIGKLLVKRLLKKNPGVKVIPYNGVDSNPFWEKTLPIDKRKKVNSDRFMKKILKKEMELTAKAKFRNEPCIYSDI